jgi:hypothetical protein
MQMKKICLTGLLLGMNHRCITNNPNKSMLQCNETSLFTFDFDQKVRSYAISWEGYAYCVLGFSESTVSPQCHENVNSALYCEVLLKLQDAIRRYHPGQLARGVLLHYDNARPHTAQVTQEIFQELQWQLLEHSPYGPDLAPSDFPLFGLLKNHPGGKRFADDEEVETEVRSG